MADTKDKGIALPALVALVVSSAIGAGIFDLPATLVFEPYGGVCTFGHEKTHSFTKPAGV